MQTVRLRLLTVTAAALATTIAALAFSAEMEEKFPGGSLKLKYSTDKDGRKSGTYFEYFEDGKTRLKATYREDVLSGPYTEYHPGGKVRLQSVYLKGKLNGDYLEKDEKGRNKLQATYKDGKLHGWKTEFDNGKAVSSQGYRDGESTWPKSVDAIKRGLLEIYGGVLPSPSPLPRKGLGGAGGGGDAKGGLNRLKAYRFLCDVPYKDLVLDEECTKYAQAAAAICNRIGRLDHTPPNPGMPEAEYKIAYYGTTHTNLYMGLTVPDRCIDGWMNDSDERNIDRVGHRRWCLNPPMVKVGFGVSGRYAAQFAHDQSRKEPFDYDYIPYPARGYFPVSYFGPRHAWNISLNPRKYGRFESGAVKVKLYAMDAAFKKSAAPLELDYFNMPEGGFGVPLCIIFRPARVEIAAGKRYRVEVEGLKGTDGKPAPLSYLVEFIDG